MRRGQLAFADLDAGRAARDEALDALEVARAGWVTKARNWAEAFCRMHGSVTTDDLHAYCPPPTDIDPRVLGCIMRAPLFRATEFVNSCRPESHHRPIRVFVLGETS